MGTLDGALDEWAPKSFRDGTHRVVTPEETLERFRQHASRMGITRLGNITGVDHIGIPVVIAVRPKSRSISVCQGKGLGLTQAFASALMEAAEYYHSEAISDRFVLASYRELTTTARVVDPAGLCGNGRKFDPRRPIEWIEGYDLLKHEPCWVPAEVVQYDTTCERIHDSGCFLRSTNGLGSGNNLLEALSSGICEVVERDAVALWVAREVRDRAGCHLDPSSIEDPAALDLLTRYERAGVGVRIWNVTSDTGIATFVCHIREESDDPRLGIRRFHGAGCHPDRGIALTRALTEAAQTRLAYINGARDDLPFEHYAEPANVDLAEALLDALQAAREPCAHRDLPHFAAADVGGDVRWELDRLQEIGIERVIAVDLTRPELGIPVVRMVVPGLESDCRNPEYLPGKRAQAVKRQLPYRKQWRPFRRARSPRSATLDPHSPVQIGHQLQVSARTVCESVAVIFAGPSLPPSARPPDPRLTWRPPARQGDIYRAALTRPAAIGLIDGYFDAVPSVWHKEILWAIQQGVRVFGAASIGALRAAELSSFNMTGIGRIYEMYNDGTLIDDDEVAVLHGPEETDYIRLTEPLVNVRETISDAVSTGFIEYAFGALITEAVKSLHYKSRTLQAIFDAVAQRGASQADINRLRQLLLSKRIDQKRLDASQMLDEVQALLAGR